MTTVQVRYFAGARAAAGVDEERLQLPAGVTVSGVLDELTGRHGERLEVVLRACSLLADGVAVKNRERVLADGVQLDVLPPFAGG